ncbi:L,D-transpeptidase family protein [Rhizobium rhizophilum]|uniref:L,D-transpeptidase family protein n=1 Tax=Rhizobium rhizophilum TaxID=1850373 RepID=UPI00198001FF|nr:L,D-transpeptidase family protein [Rhizobium rhizophilum]
MTKRPKAPIKIGRTISRLVVRPAPRDQRKAILQAGHLAIPAALGRSGRTSRKREGDGATPIATMPLLFAYRRGDRGPWTATSLPMRISQPNMLWCDDVNDPNYNRPVRSPFHPSHEKLQREDELYDICIVLDWNLRSRKRKCGSAIFFHIARPGYTPTEGCVAISPRDMRRLLPLLSPKTVLQVL